MPFDRRDEIGGRQHTGDVGAGLANSGLGEGAQPGLQMRRDLGLEGRAVGMAALERATGQGDGRHGAALAARRTAFWNACIATQSASSSARVQAELITTTSRSFG